MWSAHTIFLLSMTNFPMWSIVREYTTFRWNSHRLLASWFDDTDGFHSTLVDTEAIVCGPSVSQFFDRTHSLPETLDICVNRNSFERLVGFLGPAMYRSTAGGNRYSSVFVPVLTYSVNTIVFHKMRNPHLKVAVHVVIGNPITFLLLCSTSTYLFTHPTCEY